MKVSEYLPFYLGCYVAIPGLANKKLLKACWMGTLIEKSIPVKLILRSFEDMTDDEYIKIAEILGYTSGPLKPEFLLREKGKSFLLGYGLSRIEDIHTAAKLIKYLTSIEVDAFNLIVDSLAIRAKDYKDVHRKNLR